MRPVRLFSFDLDGTLIDTVDEIALAANLALREHGLPAQSPASIRELVGQGSTALVRTLHARLVGEATAPEVGALIAAFDMNYAAAIGRRSRAYPGAALAFERLRAAGIRCVCTTNKNEAPSRALLAAHGLVGYLDLLIGGDTLAWRKPDRRVLRHALDRFGIAPDEAVHLGDSVTDIRSARDAGLAAWAVPWGYTGGAPIEQASPDAVFPSLIAAADFAVGRHLGGTRRPPRAAERRIERRGRP